MCENPTINTVHYGERLNACHLRSGTKQGCPLSTDLFSKGLGGFVKAMRHEEEIKGAQTRKEVVRFPFSRNVEIPW